MEGGYLTTCSIEGFFDYKRELSGLDVDLDLKYCYFDSAPIAKNNIFNNKGTDEVKIGSITLLEFDGKPINKKIAIVLYNNEDKPIYVSIGTTYYSSDGEFRGKLLEYENVIFAFDEEQGKIEQGIQLLLKEHTMKFEAYNTDLDPHKVMLLFYILYRRNPDYDSHKYLNPYEIVHKYLLDISYDIIFAKAESGSFNIKNTKQEPQPSICIKMIPLSIASILNFNDISNDIWMELYTTIECSNIILNGRTCGLPFIYNKSYFKNEKYKQIFDLPITHIKFKHSKIAEQVENHLKQASSETKMDDIYINYDFEEVDQVVTKAIKLSETSLHLSDHSILLYMEYQGLTISELLNKVLKMSQFKSVPSKRVSREPTFVSQRTIFQVAYSLYVLNLSGIIQGDLHLNNVTLKGTNFKSTGEDYFDCFCLPKFKERKVKIDVKETDMYNGKDHTIKTTIHEQEAYYIKADVFAPVIIDFSRAILLKDFENEHTQLLFDAKQKKKIHQTYKALFPDFYLKNRQRLAQEMTDFKTFFNKYAAIDLYRFCSLLAEKYRDSPIFYSKKGTPKRLFNLLLKTKGMMEDILLSNEPCLVNPNLVLLNSFTKYLEKPDLPIGNMYIAEAPMYYSIEKYDTLPPLCKIFKAEPDVKYPSVNLRKAYEDRCIQILDDCLKYEFNLKEFMS